MERTTVEVYEAGARRWLEERPARFVDRAERLAAAVAPGAVRADLGSGAGKHLTHLGQPVLALDAAWAMLALGRSSSPGAWAVQADLEALPLRWGSLGGAWARASYLHVPKGRLPYALAQLHRAMTVGAPFHATVMAGDGEGPLPDDEFPGRFFARWTPDALVDVLVGAGFTVESCDADGEWLHAWATRARTLPDYVAPGLDLLVVGLNPSLYAADRGVGFARPGNRFWPAALAVGLVTRDRDPAHALVHHRVGMTDLVKRATVGAAELTADEYRAGLARLERLVTWLRPRAVCVLGLAGWRAAKDRRAVAGEQAQGLAGVPVYLMPNPSGLNAQSSSASLAEHLRAALALGR